MPTAILILVSFECLFLNVYDLSSTCTLRGHCNSGLWHVRGCTAYFCRLKGKQALLFGVSIYVLYMFVCKKSCVNLIFCVVIVYCFFK